ncbi:MAG TPA: patatin-like protein [Allosphingosinicella sp.]|nr:patatin-like protein [Allosphingosinicella sp.]
MHEKELRLALVCYGGVSLAVYMHGITREIWHLAQASEAHHAGRDPERATEKVYAGLLRQAEEESQVSVRVLVDILAGASAGGINAIFLAEAIASGSSLEPLTALWLDGADVDRLIDPEVSGLSRFAKAAALPFAWALSGRGKSGNAEDGAQRGEVRAKVASFVRARWFAPPFSGPGFTGILIDAIEAMKREGSGTPLLPPGHPLDLAVTVTDFHGFPQVLRLNSPREVLETEHRLTFSFRAAGAPLGSTPDLAFAARATASFPGAFPPFTVAELDSVLAGRGMEWPARASFLAAAFPRRSAEEVERAVLIDGSILANAPFRPAIAALQNRPARREVDRRFVYIDPKPGIRSVRLGPAGQAEPPGFFATIFGALSDIPREQPIRDNLEAIEARSARVRRMNRILEAIRPQVESAIDRAFGGGFFVRAPTAARLKAWRARAHALATRQAGFAYAAYGQLKLSRVVEESILHLCRCAGTEPESGVRTAIWRTVRQAGVAGDDAFTARGTSEAAIRFLGAFDTGFRIRRLRFLARTLQTRGVERPALRVLLDSLVARYRAAAAAEIDDLPIDDADAALASLSAALDLGAIDAEADARLAEALSAIPRAERKPLIVAYIGFPFYDIATFPLLQEDGRDEYDPIKVDRISPDDATAIRSGGAAATLKGIQFNSFGAFFSRAWRENDYLWGRLHGADRLIDILLSTVPAHRIDAAAVKREAFRAILAEEEARLTAIVPLFETLRREIG